MLYTANGRKGAAMNIWFVRHGETANNKEKLLQGRSDAPLNENGISQAETARAFFNSRGISIDAVYSSPLCRAVQTARIIAGEDAEITEDELLIEMDYGPYEGTSLLEPDPEIIRFFSDFVHNPAPEGMESLDHVKERMSMFLQKLKDSDAENILVATHAIAMKGALECLTPESRGAYWSKHIGTCAVYMTVYEGKMFSVPREVYTGFAEFVKRSD